MLFNSIIPHNSIIHEGKKLSFIQNKSNTLKNSVTVIIGQNGTGKSTILSEIGIAFRNYYGTKTQTEKVLLVIR